MYALIIALAAVGAQPEALLKQAVASSERARLEAIPAARVRLSQAEEARRIVHYSRRRHMTRVSYLPDQGETEAARAYLEKLESGTEPFVPQISEILEKIDFSEIPGVFLSEPASHTRSHACQARVS